MIELWSKYMPAHTGVVFSSGPRYVYGLCGVKLPTPCVMALRKEHWACLLNCAGTQSTSTVPLLLELSKSVNEGRSYM